MKALRRFSIVGTLAKSPKPGEQEDEEASGSKSPTSPGRTSNPTSPPSPRGSKKKSLEVSDEKKTLNPLYRYNTKTRSNSGGMATLSSFFDDRKSSISRSSGIYSEDTKLSPDERQKKLRAQTMSVRRNKATTLPVNEIFQKSNSCETPTTLNDSGSIEDDLESPKSPKSPKPPEIDIPLPSPSPSDPLPEKTLIGLPPSRKIPVMERGESFSYRRRSMSIDSFLHLQHAPQIKLEETPEIRNSDSAEHPVRTRSLTHSAIITVSVRHEKHRTVSDSATYAMEEAMAASPIQARRNTIDDLSAPVVNLGELSPFNNDMSLRDQYTQEEGIIYKEIKDRENNKRVVAGTLDRLISNLADGKPGDTEYICEFVLTHHYFMDAKTLLTKLLQRCNVEPPVFCTPEQLETFHSSVKVIKIRTINVLKKWMELRFSDFEDMDMEQMVFDFAEKLGSDGESHRFWGDNLLKTYELHLMAQSMGELVSRGSQTPPKPILPTNLMPRLIRFLDLHPVEIARQMCIIQYQIFSKVKLQEYFQQGWTKPESGTSPHVLALIEDFNRVRSPSCVLTIQMTFWTATEIVMAKPSKQPVTISRFIEVMENLLQLQNYHGVMMIFSALHMGCVQQLEKAWKDVSSRHMNSLKVAGDIMSPSQNYKRYREILKKSTPPLIPFQVVFLSDFTAIDEIPTTLSNGMQNFEKLRIIAGILSSLIKFQKMGYNFIPVPYITEFWKISSVLTEKELYTQVKKSLQETQDEEGTLSSKFKTLMKKKREDS